MVHKAYAGGSGSVNVGTSMRAEKARDERGLTDEHQLAVLAYLRSAREQGGTKYDISDWCGEESGRMSTALTNLHIGGYVHRSNRKRGSGRSTCHVYTLPEFGKDEKPYHPQKAHLHSEESIVRAERMAAFLHDRSAHPKPPSRDPQPGDQELARMLEYLAAKSRKELEARNK